MDLVLERRINPGKVFDLSCRSPTSPRATARWTSAAPSRCCCASERQSGRAQQCRNEHSARAASKSRPSASAAWASASATARRPRRRGDHADPRRVRARRHLLRHGRSLRPVHQRGARRRGAAPDPRPGRDRHQVRLQERRRQPTAWTAGPSASAQVAEAVAEAAADRPHRPLLPAPRRPRACRWRTSPARSRT